MKILQLCPPRLSDVATLRWEIQKKSFSNILLIICYPRRKQTVIHLPTPPENVTTSTCKLQNFFVCLKVCCVLSSVGSSELSQLWVVVGGSDKNHLWWVAATGMSGIQSQQLFRVTTFCVNTSFDPDFFDTDQSHHAPRCAEIQPMSQQPAAASLNMSPTFL